MSKLGVGSPGYASGGGRVMGTMPGDSVGEASAWATVVAGGKTTLVVAVGNWKGVAVGLPETEMGVRVAVAVGSAVSVGGGGVAASVGVTVGVTGVGVMVGMSVLVGAAVGLSPGVVAMMAGVGVGVAPACTDNGPNVFWLPSVSTSISLYQ